MKFHKLSKNDFHEFKYQFTLCLCYSIILAIVYAYWVMVSINIFYLACIVFIGFVLCGALVFYFWINHLKNKKEKAEE